MCSMTIVANDFGGVSGCLVVTTEYMVHHQHRQIHLGREEGRKGIHNKVANDEGMSEWESEGVNKLGDDE